MAHEKIGRERNMTQAFRDCGGTLADSICATYFNTSRGYSSSEGSDFVIRMQSHGFIRGE
jgi:hypothetical protein